MTDMPDNPRFQRIFLALGGAVVGIFALAVLLGVILVRDGVRDQILQRDGILLTSVAQFLHDDLDPAASAHWDLIELALDTSAIRGVIAVRVFEPLDSMLQQVPATVYAVSLDPADQQRLRGGAPLTRYFPEFHLDGLFSDAVASGAAVPLVEVIAPLTGLDGEVDAAIQYWLDGAEVHAEFARLDRHLLTMGLAFILGGALIFTVVFLYARRRLIGMARVISERNRSLERANAELSLAARTSAIGSVTSQLFHGLKNPLAGLKSYLRMTGQDEEAMELTNRMQRLIDETLAVIREEDYDWESSLTLEEFLQLASQRVSPATADDAVPVHIESAGRGEIPAHKAQLLLLVIRNLVDNAIESSPAGAPVHVRITHRQNTLAVEVSDRGEGLPEHVKSRLFEPVRSTKSGGTGIGLAISSVIARHIPAELALAHSDSSGTRFQITMAL
jgi:signal transduction histidine kinase